MNTFWRLTIYSLVYLVFWACFFGISDALDWGIEPTPGFMGGVIGLYLGALVPLWKTSTKRSKGGRSEPLIDDWDKEMERRRKLAEENKKKKEAARAKQN